MSRRGRCRTSEPAEEGLCCHYQAIFVRLGDDVFVFLSVKWAFVLLPLSPSAHKGELRGRAHQESCRTAMWLYACLQFASGVTSVPSWVFIFIDLCF